MWECRPWHSFDKIFSFKTVFLFSGKCDVPLGLEDGRIPNPMFRASSSYNYYCAARNARLHQRRAGRNGGAWCSRTRNNRQWLQVDFGTDTIVTRVCTQGRHNADQWVTSYYVSFSSRGQRFITYKEGRRTKVREYSFFPFQNLRPSLSENISGLFQAASRALNHCVPKSFSWFPKGFEFLDKSFRMQQTLLSVKSYPS